MKKWIVFVVAALLLLTCGCTGNGPDTQAASIPESKPTVPSTICLSAYFPEGEFAAISMIGLDHMVEIHYTVDGETAQQIEQGLKQGIVSRGSSYDTVTGKSFSITISYQDEACTSIYVSLVDDGRIAIQNMNNGQTDFFEDDGTLYRQISALAKELFEQRP